MRPVHLHDLDAVVRALMAASFEDRETIAQHAVQAADIADRYRKRLGRAHPVFGNGTLTSAVQDLPRKPALRCDASYRPSLGQFLAALG